MKKTWIGKVIYAILFLLVIPLLQWIWAEQLEKTLTLPAIKSRPVGLILGIPGFLLMTWALISLMVFGKGLPMNAYPPPVFVKKGPYFFLRHPVYWGYGLFLTGVFLFTGSSAGIWIVTPVSILAMIALVLGYENIDLIVRFPGADRSVLLEWPPAEDKKPLFRYRLAAFLWVFFLLVGSNLLIWFLYRDSATNEQRVTNLFPQAWIQVGFLLTFLISFLFPFLSSQTLRIRQWGTSAVLGLSLSTAIGLFWHWEGSRYLLLKDLSAGGNYGLLGIHVPFFLLLITARALRQEFRNSVWPVSLFILFRVALSFTDSPDAFLYLLFSILVFLLAAYYQPLGRFIRNRAEGIANSWKEWTWGPVRVINHGWYVGLGAFGGILFSGSLAGRHYAWAILIFAFVVIVSSALWAQLIEGSDKLKRPFGFYGALLGIAIACLILWQMGYNGWVLVGAISVVMPWVQAAGRFRCLVNGCCHGKPTENNQIGIRYYHPRSRVCTISGLKGRFLHPTPVYSILWLFITGFLMLALWYRQLPYSFLFGFYLILTGLGRFVEEAYRGEVQTPLWKGLRLYQWAALASVIAGIILSLVPVQLADLSSESSWEIWLAAGLGGIFTFFAMGVDFPRSNARFSRLV